MTCCRSQNWDYQEIKTSPQSMGLFAEMEFHVTTNKSVYNPQNEEDKQTSGTYINFKIKYTFDLVIDDSILKRNISN